MLLRAMHRFSRRSGATPSLVPSQGRAFGAFANHRDTEDNLASTPFEFTSESWEAIQVLLKKYPDNYKSSAVIPALFIA